MLLESVTAGPGRTICPVSAAPFARFAKNLAARAGSLRENSAGHDHDHVNLAAASVPMADLS
jgi:hypothetical protein